MVGLVCMLSCSPKKMIEPQECAIPLVKGLSRFDWLLSPLRGLNTQDNFGRNHFCTNWPVGFVLFCTSLRPQLYLCQHACVQNSWQGELIVIVWTTPVPGLSLFGLAHRTQI